MKKIVLSLALVAMMSVSFVSCKDAAAPEATEEATPAMEEAVENATEATDSTAAEATEAVEATAAPAAAATEEVKK